MSALRRLRRLRPAALGPCALPGLEGRAAARHPGPPADRDRDPAAVRRGAGHAPARWRCTPGRGNRAGSAAGLQGAQVLGPGRHRRLPDRRPGDCRRRIPALKRLAAPLFEHPKSAPTLHVTLTATGLDVDITGVERKSGGLSADARVLLAERAARGRLRPGHPGRRGGLPGARCRRCSWARPWSPCRRAPSCRRRHRPRPPWPPSSSRPAAGATRIADLFCGVGTFTFRLAEVAPVHAADAAPEAVQALISAPGRRAGPAWRHRRGPRPGPPAGAGPGAEEDRRRRLRPAARRRRRTGAPNSPARRSRA